MRRGLGSRVRSLVQGLTMFTAAGALVLDGSFLWLAVPGAALGAAIVVLALE